jgi:curved DNA-binding protein CbpA
MSRLIRVSQRFAAINRKDALRILKVHDNAKSEEIRAAFLTLAKEQHPDRGGSHEEFQQVVEAFEATKVKSDNESEHILKEFYAKQEERARLKQEAGDDLISKKYAEYVEKETKKGTDLEEILSEEKYRDKVHIMEQNVNRIGRIVVLLFVFYLIKTKL